MKTILAAAALIAIATPASHAARYSPLSGERLLQTCIGRNTALRGGCVAYLDGVSDAITSYQAALPADGSKGGKLPGYICVPGHMSGAQLREAYIAWAKQHQNELKVQASAVVIRALLQLYPCKP